MEWECPICMDTPIDPCVPPNCMHYCCRACFAKIKPNNDKLLCPVCREPFAIEEIKPYMPSLPPMRYCLDLTCQPGSKCTKVHIDELCEDLPKVMTYSPENGKKEVSEEDKSLKFELPKNTVYCWDICCPGGKEAKCGKKHECDLIITGLPS